MESSLKERIRSKKTSSYNLSKAHYVKTSESYLKQENLFDHYRRQGSRRRADVRFRVALIVEQIREFQTMNL